MRRIGMALAGLALLVPACGMVPDDAYAQAPPGQDCRAAEHHQFDFWIGVWDVTVVKEPGQPQAAGTNRIERVMGGCALEGGNALLLSGTYSDGRMVLNSEPNDAGAFDRITWSAQPDGSVRQVWEQTTDGRTWKTAFDGHYVRTKSS